MRLTHGQQAVFLDLNGTLVLPVQAASPWEYHPIPGAIEAVARLTKAGFVCPVVTTQSRIGKGLYTEEAFRLWFDEFSRDAAGKAARFAGLYLCPHRFHSGCACGKPNTRLYDQATYDHGIYRGRSFVVGDSLDDLESARRMGMTSCLVLTAWGETAREKAPDAADHISADLSQAVDWILAC